MGSGPIPWQPSRPFCCLAHTPARPFAGSLSDDLSARLKRFHRCRKPHLVGCEIREHGSNTNKHNSITGYRHRTSQEKRSSRESVGLSDPRYRRGAQTLRVRGRVVSVVLRSDDDDLCIESTRAALPLAGFLPGDSRNLADSDDQRAVEAGGGRIKHASPQNSFLIIVLVLVVVLVLGYRSPGAFEVPSIQAPEVFRYRFRTRPIELRNAGLFSGAACCQLTELPLCKAAPLQADGQAMPLGRER